MGNNSIVRLEGSVSTLSLRTSATLLGGLLLCCVLSCAQKPSYEWHQESGYRWAQLSVPDVGESGFQQLPPSKTEVFFANSLTQQQIAENRLLLGGSGVATGDVDGDGLADIYFCGLDTTNFLYKNLGNWRFKNITRQAGVACPDRFSTGATFADLDGDHDLDLLVTALGGPNACFLNNSAGEFTEVTNSAGLASTNGSTSLALADIDADGDLDLYLTNLKRISVESLFAPNERRPHDVVKSVGDGYEVVSKFKEHYRVEIIGGQPVMLENAEPDVLYLNNGDGTFTAAPFERGRFLDEEGNRVAPPRDWGLMARFEDLDQDGDPDIYVCNDYTSPDRIWINDGTGNFQAIPKLAIRHTSRFTMAVDFSDIDRDGDSDFLLIDMLAMSHSRRMRQAGTLLPEPQTPIGDYHHRPQVKRNTLFLNRGDNSFAEIAQFSGVQASEWTWSARFLDVDLDGYEDVITANGQLYDLEDSDTNDRVQRLATLGHDYRQLSMLYPDYRTPNVAFRNKGDLTFEDMSSVWGFVDSDLASGMAFADFDLDGDLDLVTNRLNDAAGVYQNRTNAPRITVRLRGLAPNTQGIGGKIKVIGGPVLQTKEVISGGTYLSGSDPLFTFAAKSASTPVTIEVQWRSGARSKVEAALPNRIYEIFEPEGPFNHSSKDIEASNAAPIFEDVSDLLDHTHHEDEFDDFARQPLLPHKLSQLGPGVAWHDLNRDGYDDLIIASGKGAKPGIFLNEGGKGFTRKHENSVLRIAEDDQTSILSWSKAADLTSVIIGLSNYESTQPGKSALLSFDVKRGSFEQSSRIVVGGSSIGPMCLADYDSDGDLDLFVGGRSLPGAYPEPAPSFLYRNQGNSFTIDAQNSEQLEAIGLVSGAVFSDIDQDGDPDLILALDWGPITILQNQDGQFVNKTAAFGLHASSGRWKGVTVGDLDEDGKLDIIASNWGSNNAAATVDSLQLLYGDFDSNGTLDIIEAHFDPSMAKLVPQRHLGSMALAMPQIRSRTPDFKSYGQAGVAEIIGESLEQAKKVHVNTLDHTVFFNRGDGFDPVPLPPEAQFAPGFHVGVADFDGDGHDDVFISQNFFATNPDEERHDSGRGLWLRGDGSGNLHPIPGHESGVMVYGEQRGAALGDFDQDGRIDLLVSQNGAQTKLYRNRRAKPGLRVRLSGTPRNSDGIGAVIRLVFGETFGPAREVHAGSGYWSQDSIVQVMGHGRPFTGVWVKWPGGKTTAVELDGAETEVTIAYSGKLLNSARRQ